MLVSTLLDPPTHLHHPTIMLAVDVGHRLGLGPERLAIRLQAVDITGEAPIINRVSRDCVGSVTLATHAS